MKVGRTPGKTREINFFDIRVQGVEGSSYFVDLPGYGYAKLSKKQRQELHDLIVWYITHPEADTALICLIMDAKVGLTDLDREFIAKMEQSGKNYIIAANKMDKINQKTQNSLLRDLKNELGTNTQVFLYSAASGKGVHKLQDFIFAGE